MRAQPQCISCIVDDLWGAIRSEVDDPLVQMDVLRRALVYLADKFSTDLPPPYFITGVHRILKSAAGIDEPFSGRRRACNRVGMAVAERLRDRILFLEGGGRFRESVRWAIAGNLLDFRTCGTGYEFDVADVEEILSASTRALDVDHIDIIYRIARDAKNVLFLHDNVGEVAFDRILIDQLRDLGARVTSGLRGGPITSDATIADGHTVGIDESADQVICVGPDTLGISLVEMSDELSVALDEADLVVAKGQANFCVLTERERNPDTEMAFLLWTKCDLAARCFGLAGKVSVATLHSMLHE